MSPNISQNNKRIAKNTLALYFRTFITMLVGLYTGRVMLQAFNEDNYSHNTFILKLIFNQLNHHNRKKYKNYLYNK